MNPSREGLWHFNFKDKKMNWSSGMFEIFYPDCPSPLDLKEFHFMVHPIDRFQWEIALNQASLGGAPTLLDTLMVLPTGENIWIRHSISAYVVEGKVIGVEGMCTDITELKLLELESKVGKHFLK